MAPGAEGLDGEALRWPSPGRPVGLAQQEGLPLCLVGVARARHEECSGGAEQAFIGAVAV